MVGNNNCGPNQELAFIIVPILCIVSGLLCLVTITATVAGLFCCVMKQERSNCGGRCFSKSTPTSPIRCSTPSADQTNRLRSRFETSGVRYLPNRPRNFQTATLRVPNSGRNPLIRETSFNKLRQGGVSNPAFSDDGQNGGVPRSNIECTNRMRNSLTRSPTSIDSSVKNQPNKKINPLNAETGTCFNGVPLNATFFDKLNARDLRSKMESQMEYIPLRDMRSLKTTAEVSAPCFSGNAGCSSTAMTVTFRKRQRSWSSPRKLNSNGIVAFRNRQGFDLCPPEKPETQSSISAEDIESFDSEEFAAKSNPTDISSQSLEWDYFQQKCCFEEYDLNDSGIDQCCIHWV